MHRSAGRLWLISGTGEGPPLARALLAAGWRLRVSVVSAEAARAYGSHPGLELLSGAIGVRQPTVAEQLCGARADADPFGWVVDATHPFASRIRAELAEACLQQGQPLLHLERPQLPLGAAELLADLDALAGRCRSGERLLLAIGARHLATARRRSPDVLHHARLLPRPHALRQALAAGLSPERVATLQPRHAAGDTTAVEQALCRQWRIETILCRRSGGPTEVHWRRIAGALGLRLLLLQRPDPPAAHGEALELEALLGRLCVPQPAI